ncbi:MAG TPA: hypothetical protein VLF71_01745 [Candidatus Saccharimonadales bacterium]|nr:hypothetical protein [Candidatus Saccharimonadales bacterium]
MEQKQAIADRLKQSNNILVTVSNNPTVDQLASCIGLTLALNKMGKHATAVFSGAVPSTIEFLQPEKTIEKNTDSLRDFIIALDKAKADKLRYKVEDTVVRIFITPYKTSISDKDLQFSQGDFNVDVVVAIGVHNQNDLDQAITAHGRILHDAVVATINTLPGGELGTINWLDPSASSLSELVTQLLTSMDPQILDGQMATSLLTGIVAETERFSNARTTPVTMSLSAALMSAGANQQLVATKLQQPAVPQPQQTAQEHTSPKFQDEHHDEDSHTTEDGTLEINHPGNEGQGAEPAEHEGHDERHEDEHHDAGPASENHEEWHEDSHEEHHEEPHPEQSSGPEQSHQEPPRDIFQFPEQAEHAPEEAPTPASPAFDVPGPAPAQPAPPPPQIHISEDGDLQGLPPLPPREPAHIDNHSGDSLMGSADPMQHMSSSHMILEPPAMAGQMDASSASPADEELPAGAPMQLPQPETGGFVGGQASDGLFTPAASANITSPSMPYLPPSMTPGAPAPAPAAPVVPEPEPESPPPFMTPSPQVVTPTAPPPPMAQPLEPPMPAMPPMPAPLSPAPGVETLSQIEADVNSPHIAPVPAAMPAAQPAQPVMGPAMGPAPMPSPPSMAPPLSPADDIFAPALPQAPPLAAPASSPSGPAAAPAQDATAADIDNARNAVLQAIANHDAPVGPEPIAALNAQPLGAPLHAADAAANSAPVVPPAPPVNMDATANPTFSLPDAPGSAGAPPAVPPPMMPPANPGQ